MKVDGVNSQHLRFDRRDAKRPRDCLLGSFRCCQVAGEFYGSGVNGPESTEVPVTASWAAARPQIAPIVLPWPL